MTNVRGLNLKQYDSTHHNQGGKNGDNYQTDRVPSCRRWNLMMLMMNDRSSIANMILQQLPQPSRNPPSRWTLVLVYQFGQTGFRWTFVLPLAMVLSYDVSRTFGSRFLFFAHE